MSSLKLHWPYTLFAAFSILVISGFYPSSGKVDNHTGEEQKMQDLMIAFERGYSKLDIPTLTLSYETNLSNVGNRASLERQLTFFNDIQLQLLQISSEDLSSSLQLEYAIIQYETAINIDRIALSLTPGLDKDKINNLGIYHQPNGSNWYLYFVKKWTSDNLSVEEIVAYGVSEVNRIHREMAEIKTLSGLSNFDKFIVSSQFMTVEDEKVQQAFENTKSLVDRKLFSSFPDFNDLPAVKIAKGTNSQLAQVPGYYSNNTFYYNLFDDPFDLKNTDWLFIHEGNPGHHFQLNYESTIDVPNYRSGISYSGFREGWAAYVEDLGKEVGLYRTSFEYFSKLEWDLIRSTRLILDVGINYHGWDDSKALIEWQKYIQGMDDIGQREISRMRRWPAQVLTYKLGSKRMKELSAQMSKAASSTFDLKGFHTTLLSQRSIPVSLIPMLFKN